MKLTGILGLLFLVMMASAQRVRMLSNNDEPSHHNDYKMNCKNWDQENQTCIECYQGCTKWENICVKVVKHCAEWDQQGNCVKCEKGYGDKKWKSVDGACPKWQKQVKPTPQPTPQTPTVQITIGGQNNETTVDQNCQCHSDDRACIYCFKGYYLDFNTTCQVLPENCTAADIQGMCTACTQGFTVQNGTCVEFQCDLSLCVTFNEDQSQCTSCPFRSYLVEGCCIQVNGFCEKWVEGTGECTSCYVGYVINPQNNKECILQTA